MALFPIPLFTNKNKSDTIIPVLGIFHRIFFQISPEFISYKA